MTKAKVLSKKSGRVALLLSTLAHVGVVVAIIFAWGSIDIAVIIVSSIFLFFPFCFLFSSVMIKMMRWIVIPLQLFINGIIIFLIRGLI